MSASMQQILAACGAASASVEVDGATWTIGNAKIRKTVTWSDGEGLRLIALEHCVTGRKWHPLLRDQRTEGGEFLFTWNDAALSARHASALQSVRTEADEASVTLALTLRVGESLAVTLFQRAHADIAVIEQWLEIAPQRAGTLSRVAPLALSVADLDAPTLHWVRGLQNHGAGMPERGPYPAYRLRSEPLGELHLHSGLRSTWHEIPWFVLQGAADGEGLFVGLSYSGRWSATARNLGQGAALELFSDGYATPLRPGERWTSPVSFLGFFCGDLDDAAHVQHAYVRRAVVPPTPEDFPWVQYNTWFAHLVDIDEAILRQEAELAARLGVEVFVIDAGWWEPSRRTDDNFTTGLGVWRPSAEKFPSGLSAFGDFVRSLGMKFGIWVEPERVDLRQEGTWRLDWLARHHDAIISPPWPPDTVSGWLCFGHPEVQAWAIDWIDRLVSDIGADWLKWDSNWWGVCTCAHHGHSATDGELHQVQGVHRVMRELRRRFPHLIIENCAGGGVRNDFAMLSHTHITWLHDASTPSRRVRFHLAGATYPFPPELCNTWVVDAEDEPLTDPTTPRHTIDAILRSRMFGALGLSARLMHWTQDAFRAMQEAISQYKQLRPLLKHGCFYHLLPQADLQCPELDLRGRWEAYAAFSADGSEGAVWVFRDPQGDSTQWLRLRGLDATRTYALKDVDAACTLRRSGATLMEQGLAINLGERTSALLLVKAAPED
ncbi:MAG: alpha-galactosidase [Caldilinea sp.]|nr:alpha-galactosidase [Caldilinea sp.]MDW8440910.1 alpha-galactosidase [Caldilineaceae bacterium]